MDFLAKVSLQILSFFSQLAGPLSACLLCSEIVIFDAGVYQRLYMNYNLQKLISNSHD